MTLHLEPRIKKLKTLDVKFIRIRTFLFFAFMACLAFSTIAAILCFGLFSFFVFLHMKLRNQLALFQTRLHVQNRIDAIALAKWSDPSISATSDAVSYEGSVQESELGIAGRHSLLELMDFTFSTAGRKLLRRRLNSSDIGNEELERRHRLRREVERFKVLRRRLLTRGLHSKEKEIESQRILELTQFRYLLGRWKFAFLILCGVYGISDVFFLQFFFLNSKPFFLLILFPLFIWISVSAKMILVTPAFENSLGLAVSLERFFVVSKVLSHLAQAPALKTCKDSELLGLLIPFQPATSPLHLKNQMEHVVAALGVRMNPIARIIFNAFLPWDFFWTIRLQTLIEKIHTFAPQWFDALAEFETTLSLVEFGNAISGSSCAPELRPDSSLPFLSVQDLGHPLIEPTRRVSHSVLLDKDHRFLITGSNMSGKSTFLRTLGLNYVLAKAGSKVCAKEFHYSNMILHTSIQRMDSLEGGLSVFLAEVKTLSQIFRDIQEKDKPSPTLTRLPVFYLIDEIYRGTNNQERYQASQAFLIAISKHLATGVVTTHDLDLITLTHSILNLQNHHFQEHFVNGKMTFSYRLEDGPCQSTNALKLIESYGLPVSV